MNNISFDFESNFRKLCLQIYSYAACELQLSVECVFLGVENIIRVVYLAKSFSMISFLTRFMLFVLKNQD